MKIWHHPPCCSWTRSPPSTSRWSCSSRSSPRPRLPGLISSATGPGDFLIWCLREWFWCCWEAEAANHIWSKSVPRQRLENDLRVKENSISIDQSKCMTLRSFWTKCRKTSDAIFLSTEWIFRLTSAAASRPSASLAGGRWYIARDSHYLRLVVAWSWSLSCCSWLVVDLLLWILLIYVITSRLCWVF